MYDVFNQLSMDIWLVVCVRVCGPFQCFVHPITTNKAYWNLAITQPIWNSRLKAWLGVRTKFAPKGVAGCENKIRA